MMLTRKAFGLGMISAGLGAGIAGRAAAQDTAASLATTPAAAHQAT